MFSTLMSLFSGLRAGERPARGPKRVIPSRKSGSRASLSVESLEDRRMLNASPMLSPVQSPVVLEYQPPPETDYFTISGAPTYAPGGGSVRITVTEHAYATGQSANYTGSVPLTFSDGGHSWSLGTVKLNNGTGTATAVLPNLLAGTGEIFATVGSLAHPQTYIEGVSNSITFLSVPPGFPPG
jgi:hypothetical protein